MIKNEQIMQELMVLDKKLRNIKFDLQNEDIDVLQKAELWIEFYEIMMKKAELIGEVEKVATFKKKKLQKEIEFIELFEESGISEYLTLKEFLNKEFEDIEKVKTYIRVIDENLEGGIPLGAMVQFAARSGTGKTTTLMRMALNMAKSVKVAHFNFEMSEMLLHKVYSKMTETFIDGHELENLLLIHGSSSKLEDVIKDIKLLNYRENVKYFIIDSRMKIVTEDKNSKDAATRISRELSELVRKLGITIILINQLSEEAIKENRIVLKESGDQFYDADLIFGLGFKYEYEIDINNRRKVKKDEFNQPVIDKTARLFKCEKNRFGEPFTGEIKFEEIFVPKIREAGNIKICDSNGREILPDLSDKDLGKKNKNIDYTINDGNEISPEDIENLPELPDIF